jgi:hypothetical protein
MLVEVVLDELVDTAAARASAEASAEFGEIFDGAGGEHFNLAVFGVAHPAAEIEFAGFAMNEPAEADALDPTTN